MNRLSVLSVGAALVLAGCLAAIVAPSAVAAAPAGVEHVVLDSFDGVDIHITVFRPEGATAETPVPLVLHSHGWAGSRTKAAADANGNLNFVGKLVDAGFGVITVDARGHGASGGQAKIHNVDWEVKDFQRVLDHAATVGWIAADPDPCKPNDVLAGATGGSYGGGYQLMLASYDCRLDALAPDMTWNDLTYSLAPYDAPKAVWIDLLYGFAKQSGTRVAPEIDEWWREIQVTNKAPAAAKAHLRLSSPLPAEIHADVLLTQGVADALFNLNDAYRNYAGLSHGANDVRLVTHLGGHVIPAPGQPLFNPNGPARGSSPCGTVGDLSIAWMKAKLLGDAAAAAGIPEIGLAMEDRTCTRLAAWPTGAESVAFPALAAPQGAGSVLAPLLEGPREVAGIGTLTAIAYAPAGGRFYASLVALDARGTSHVVDDQATGYDLPVGCAPCSVSMDLGGVATKLAAGDQLLLRVDGLNEWSATASQRTPAAVALADVTVTVPVLE